MTDIVAPLPGTLWKLDVQVGDRVAAGDSAFVMEVMKTEYPVVFEAAGSVVAIHAAEGDFLEPGQAVVVVE